MATVVEATRSTAVVAALLLTTLESGDEPPASCKKKVDIPHKAIHCGHVDQHPCGTD
jgi:hypothetical protein